MRMNLKQFGFSKSLPESKVCRMKPICQDSRLRQLHRVGIIACDGRQDKQTICCTHARIMGITVGVKLEYSQLGFPNA